MTQYESNNKIEYKPLITVVVPVFKVEKYLKRCVNSILNQTYENLEVILIDDGSPDSCPQICDEFKCIDERIVVVHQENRGLSGARNTGIAIAKGKYITFIDSDDFVSNLYIEQLYNTLLLSGNKISACSFSYSTKDFSKTVSDNYTSFSAKEAIAEIITEQTVHPSAWGKLYDTELFNEIEFPEGKVFEDYATVPKLIYYANGLSYVASRLYFYTYNEDSITKSTFNSKQLQYFEIADSINLFLKENFPELLSLANCRDVNMAISYFRKMSRDEYDNNNDYLLLVNRIRKDFMRYLISHYPLSKKVAALLIVVFPSLAKIVLRRMVN